MAQADSLSLLALAARHMKGTESSPANPTLAASLYRRAHDTGDGMGSYCLGVCYVNGTGVPQSKAEARRLYAIAVERGCGQAAVTLGDMHEEDGDLPGALKLYLFAAARKVGEGALRAGLLLGGGSESDGELSWTSRQLKGDAKKVKKKSRRKGKGSEGRRRKSHGKENIERTAGEKPAVAKWSSGTAERQRVSLLEKDAARAFSLYLVAEEMSAENSVVRAAAQRCVGIAYMDGEGVPRDWDRAVHWITRAVDCGDEPVAMYLLGELYRRGDPESSDYTESASSDSSQPAFAGVSVGNDEKKPVEALRLFEKAAHRDHGPAAFAAGVMLESGDGVERDFVRAVANYRKAVDLGEIRAFARLGDAMEAGRGVERSVEDAYEMYAKGARMGSGECALKAGLYCKRGDFCFGGMDRAVYYWEKCADEIPRAAFELAVALRDGIGCQKDSVRALGLLQRACGVIPEAIAEKGVLLQKGGEGVDPDVDAANDCYRTAAENGQWLGAWCLARNLEKGVGVEADLAKAWEWYKKGAELGCGKCWTKLGFMRQKGTGCERDQEEAVKCFRKAAELSEPKGMRRLARCLEKGEGVQRDADEALKWSLLAAGIAEGDEDQNADAEGRGILRGLSG